MLLLILKLIFFSIFFVGEFLFLLENGKFLISTGFILKHLPVVTVSEIRVFCTPGIAEDIAVMPISNN